MPKEGTGFDLAIAMAILCLDNRALRLDGHSFIGELALDGSVRPVTGVLPMARCLRAAGVRRLAVADENAAEAALVDSLEVVGVASRSGVSSAPPLIGQAQTLTRCQPYALRRS